nr:transposase family protein [Amphibacillus cookii]
MKCACKTKRVHGYRNQKLEGPTIPHDKVKMLLRKRRYLCQACGKTFYERLLIVGHYQRMRTSV